MAVYGVRKEKIQGIYQSKGMACSVYVKKDDKEVAHFVTWSGLTKHVNKAAKDIRIDAPENLIKKNKYIEVLRMLAVLSFQLDKIL